MATSTKIRKPLAKKEAAARVPAAKKKAEVTKDIAKTYNAFKTFEGKQYTGMKIGRGHNGITTKVSGKKRRSLLMTGSLPTRLPRDGLAMRPKVLAYQSVLNITGIFLRISMCVS